MEGELIEFRKPVIVFDREKNGVGFSKGLLDIVSDVVKDF